MNQSLQVKESGLQFTRDATISARRLDGIFLIFPHTLVYLVFWKLGLPVSTLQRVFDALNLLGVGLAFSFLTRQRTALFTRETLFWGGLFLSLWIPGAYLEFPSDPWEHLQRINQWEHIQLIEDAIYPQKMASLWFYSLLKWIPISHRRFGLDLLSAFLQTAMLFQFHKIFDRFEVTREHRKLHVLGVLVLFGTNLFSFRYYAFSTTIIAYIAYLTGLHAFFDFLSGKRKALWGFLVALLVAITNHRQEVFYLVVSGGVLGLFHVLRNMIRPNLKNYLLLVAAIGGLIGVGPLSIREFPNFYNHFGRELFTSFGVLKVWSPSLPFIQTWGVHGLLALVLSFVFFRSLLPFSALTLYPLLFLVTPLGFVSLSPFLTHATDAYRVLYAFPTSVALLGGLSLLVQKLGPQPLPRKTQSAILVVALTLLSLSPEYPWRGRLAFQFYRPSSTVTLARLEELALWIRENRNWDPNCPILTDRATRFALVAFLGSNRPLDRFVDSPNLNTLTTPEGVNEEFQRGKYCGILILDPEKIAIEHNSPDSWVPRLSGHWSPLRSDPISLRSKGFERAVENLVKGAANWNEIDIPPFYRLIEPLPPPLLLK
jgi:hypothetical protein